MAQSQVCTNLGQNPGTAFPVCGSSAFVQTTVAICGDRTIPTPCTTPEVFKDKNPYWYKFTCFASGPLGFVITPNNLDDDYDWQLFDVTGHNPEEIYTDPQMFVACNWSGDAGKTGASSIGKSLQLCEGSGVPLFSAMPQLQQGHNYLLLVSHFTNSQSGYSLEFNSGSASITDTTPPRLQIAKSSCDRRRISIKLNKKMKCRSLAANGSDFTISDPSVSVNEASAISCSAGFDMDSLILTLRSPLAPGNYSINIVAGSDTNTLLDNCDAAIPAGDSLSFTVLPSQPAAFDSISSPGCAPDELNLIFSDPILCNSVAADGSDFLISGLSSAVITGASTICSGNVSTIIKLKLSVPIYNQGTYQVTLTKGSDGNTIINECSLETPAGSTVNFSPKDTVSANFNYTINYGCKADTGTFTHDASNGVNEWNWQFGNNAASTKQNPVYVFPGYGEQHVRLYVSNGTCSDSAETIFNLDNELKANFTAPSSLCPQDVATFKDSSIGKVVSWNWNFGNGNTSTVQDPPIQVYQIATADKNYPVRLIVRNDRNCFDTAYRQVKVLYNCYIAVATAFTPNNDGINDFLYPINAYKAKNLVFKVYNRFGQLVFETTDFMRKWDGTFKGMKQQTGTYVWTLQYINTDTDQPFSSKGTAVLIR
ncbi:MAG: gliding motility-associated C-terminal domain-containing protein [Segetibacter sp.]